MRERWAGCSINAYVLRLNALMRNPLMSSPEPEVAVSKERFVRAALDEFLQGDSYLPVTTGPPEKALSESERAALASIGMARTAATAANADAACCPPKTWRECWA